MTDNGGHEQRYLRFASSMLTIGTWNVRSMNVGKLDIVKKEMIRTGIDVLGVAELRWKGMGHFNSETHKVFYSGNEASTRNGVAFLVAKKTADSVLGYNPISDRIITIRLYAQPVNLTCSNQCSK